MGSLASRPKVPPQPQVVYVPQPVAQPSAAASAAASSTASSASSAAQSSVDPNSDSVSKETATKVRQQSLLGRERSRFGTVLTSFRGLLGTANTQAQPRKTLLGE